MRRIVSTALAAALTIGAAMAQKGLCVTRFFDGEYGRRKDVVRVEVRGSRLKPYGLKVFRSVTLHDDGAALAEMERCVADDGRAAVDRETGHVAGRLYYGFYCLPPDGGTNRYLFFRNASLRRGGRSEATLVYMEGNATLEDLKRMFE